MAHGPLVCKCVYALHDLSLFIEHNFHNRQDKRVDLRKKIIKYVFTYRNFTIPFIQIIASAPGINVKQRRLEIHI